MSEHAVREDLEAYALDALDHEERRVVEEHLSGCDECRAVVAEHERALAALPAVLAAASDAGPSGAVRASVLRMAARRPPARRIVAALAAAAALLLVVALAWSVQLSQTLAQERELYRRLAGQQEIVFEVVDSPRTTKLFLRSPVSGSSAYGKVFVRDDLPFIVAMAGRLPPTSDERRFHVWLTLASGETLLVGTLEVDADGFGSLVYEFERSGPEIQSARVTLQAVGASAPEGVPVIFGSR